MNTYFEKLKMVKARQATYPAIVLLFTAAVIAIFFYSAQFLSNNLNKIFIIDDASPNAQVTTLDVASYAAVAKKLGLGDIK